MTIPASPEPARLSAAHITVSYGGREVIGDLSLDIPAGELTVIVGPNACGKSTLLRALARMLPVSSGEVTLDGSPIRSLAPKRVAKLLGLLPQSPTAPDGIVVEDLVARGRYPHQGLLAQWGPDDQAAVDSALGRAGVTALADRPVGELSGGQRQRVWVAMALAQETPILLLDEPTTFLDIAHQVEVLNLARDLQRDGFTVVVVLHELNLAFRYATHLVVMRAGEIVAQGTPAHVVTPQLIEHTYDLPCRIITDPESGTPLVIPLADGGGGGVGRRPGATTRLAPRREGVPDA